MHCDLAARDDRNDLQVLIEKHGIGAGSDFQTPLIGKSQTVGGVSGDQRKGVRKRETEVAYQFDHCLVIAGDFADGLPDDVAVSVKTRHYTVAVRRKGDLLNRHAAGNGGTYGRGRLPQIAGAVCGDIDVAIV